MRHSKNSNKAILVSILFGLFIWIIDALLDYFIFYEDTFLNLLLFNIPAHEIYIRSLILICFVIYGCFYSRIIVKLQKTTKNLEDSKNDLAQNHKLLTNLLNGLDGILYVSDPNSYEIIYTNDKAKQHFGQDIIGKKCHKVLQNFDTPCPFCTNPIIFKQKQGESYTWEFKNKTSNLWYRSIDRVITWTDGRKVKLALATDITEIREQQKWIQETEEKFRQILSDVSSVAMQGYDKNHKVIYWNKACEILYGYTEEEAIGKCLEDLIIPLEMQKGVSEAIENWYNNGVVIPAGELALKKKDGSDVIVYSSHVMIKKSDGENEMFCIDIDISKIKKAEQKLLAAKEKAEEADRLKSRFLSNMSHEIRTPMNGILGFTELLKNPQLSGKQQNQYIEIIKESGERMLDTVNNIIDISKIESGQIELTKSNFNAVTELFSLYSFFKPEAEGKQLSSTIKKDLNQEILMFTDKHKFTSIITNLIKNAIKFTDSGGIEIDFSQEGKWFNFSISDTGIGIPEEHRDTIFNRFEQADIDDKYAFQGSGLGLSISKSYAELLGGSLKYKPIQELDNEKKTGSVFYFSIPVNAPD